MDKNTQIVAEFEQVETTTSQIAIVISGYYKDLLDHGTPPDLASILTQELHRQWWSVMLSTNKPKGSKGV